MIEWKLHFYIKEMNVILKITFEEVKNNEAVKTYIQKADESLISLGYTEHSFPHVSKVADLASSILKEFGYTDREAELARIAGYLHDIGNVINRVDHAQSGAVMAFRILDNMGADPEDIATIITAIGNHDESTAFPVNAVAAALILADKTDVRYTRVRSKVQRTHDIHDRVNFAVKESKVTYEKASHVTLDIKIDTKECAVMDYFEIFLNRMILCRKAAAKLGAEFRLVINDQPIM